MSQIVYPSPSRISFVLCEGIRPEAHGKIQLLGVFVGGEVLVNETAPTDGAIPLALYWVFEDGEGEINWKADLLGPNGNTVWSQVGDKQSKTAEQQMAIALVFPFPLAEVGKYTVRITIDAHTYERQFRFKRGPIPGVPPSGAPLP